MSTAITSFKPALAIRASLPPSSRKPDPNRPNPGSVNWWAPLFGWPSDPSHAAATATATIPDGDDQPEMPNPEAQKAAAAAAAWPPRSRFALGGFTEEKAKQLRRKTRESSSFHDAMYHSAIAARLASDSD
ncbi:uncharacterized protein LOC115678428 [Syzygium oleosum]|uniref:uncharacterized protein LOC115678428 n=1 Tax=Syzygium oleosum TaxID=219896 RepID=UPI0011D1D748|nr:uncharacterized protein LOC115678428 [Syzygium oleosum]